MRQFEVFELRFAAPAPKDSDVQVNLSAVFTCEGKSKRVKGFYAGNCTYIIRFLPVKCGVYTWETEGIISEKGEEQCECALPQKHGLVEAEGVHFRYKDNTLYQPFGTTVYALAHQSRELIDTTLNTLKQSPFNKVRFCLFPKHYDFNHNEPTYYAFEKKGEKWDVHKPVFAFWEAFEEILQRLDNMGIQADLILFHPYDRWGFSTMDKEDCLVYLDYLLRRFSAYPNLWWSLANEYDLMEHYSIEDFVQFGLFVKDNDPYGHLLSNHNCFGYWDFKRPEVTHCCIQDVNVCEVPELQREYKKPVVFDECRYEGNIAHNWGNISAKEMVHRFWSAMTYGGYCTHGETYYSEDDILWWSRGGTLKGESPARIQFLKDIFESFDGPMDFVEEGLTRFTVEEIERMKETGLPKHLKQDFFAKGLITFPREKMLPFMLRNRPCLGHVGEKVYLRYMEKECAARTEIILPDSGEYMVEIIDTWEMTRTVVEKNVNGKVTVLLPGKEGMAILAYK